MFGHMMSNDMTGDSTGRKGALHNQGITLLDRVIVRVCKPLKKISSKEMSTSSNNTQLLHSIN